MGDGVLNSHFDLSKHKQLLLYPSRLSEGGLLSAARQRILLHRNRHKMDVIAHQTIVPPANGVALAILTQQLQVDYTVLLSMENGSSPVASLRHVMRQSDRNHTCDSRHWNGGGLSPDLLSEMSRMSAPSRVSLCFDKSKRELSAPSPVPLS